MFYRNSVYCFSQVFWQMPCPGWLWFFHSCSGGSSSFCTLLQRFSSVPFPFPGTSVFFSFINHLHARATAALSPIPLPL